jgi:hypothetical protein
MVTTLARWVWGIVKPPHGCGVRRYVALGLIGFGLIRLLRLPAAGSVALSWMPFEAYGLIKVGIGVALLATTGKRRLTPAGYAAAWVGLAFCAMAAADSLPYLNGAWLYALMCWALLGEAASRHECI